jgi:A/G-specific adenine glycosylase
MEQTAETTPPDISEPRLARLRSRLLDWYRQNRRDLPWRRTRDPYRILVSEVMLQQTQVDRVIPKYHLFLERFPALQILADAPVDEVIRVWAGLGYNRRALNLQRTARAVIELHGGAMPRSVEELRALPGIGPYTAGAIACFAYEQDVGFFDTNIRRVLHRLFYGPEAPVESAGTKALQALADQAVPPGEGYEWNQALMEFGALQCTARKPACLTCPLQADCAAFPAIQTVLAELARTGFRRKREASFDGSNRYYRGRVVAALRDLPSGATLSMRELGPRVREGFGPEHSGWLYEVVDGLRRDGLLEVAEDSAAYDAGAVEARVRLPSELDSAEE